MAFFSFLFVAVCTLSLSLTLTRSLGNVGNLRIPPGVDASFGCRLEGGPPGRYPVTASYYSTFHVPPLPSSFNPGQQTYYIYVDYHMNPDGQGEDNQFVPQLMLGNVLCNSTNSGEYKPGWCQLKEWHIQAQYYFQSNNGQTSHAVTGAMIPVAPNDIIYVEFVYDTTQFVWTLNIGIQNTTSVSTVIATQPYMGLNPNVQSWNEAVYQTGHLGCQWELYGLQEQANYPLYMNYTVTVQSHDGSAATWWQNWQFNATAGCKYQPSGYVESSVNQAQTQQIGEFDLFYT